MDRLSRVIAGGCLTLAMAWHGRFRRPAAAACGTTCPKENLTRPMAIRLRSASTLILTRARRWGTGCISPTRPIRTASAAAANQPQYGTPTPNTSPYGMPTANKYGPVGTAGTRAQPVTPSRLHAVIRSRAERSTASLGFG